MGSALVIVSIGLVTIIAGTLIGIALEMRDYRRNRTHGEFLEDVLRERAIREGNDTAWRTRDIGRTPV